MERSIKGVLIFVSLFIACPAIAQLPNCNRIYMDRAANNLVTFTFTDIFNFDPALPVSATNPSLNTISLPPDGGGGLTVSRVLGSTNPIRTFYTVNFVTGELWYCDPVTLVWASTGHTMGHPNALNLGAGGDYIYGLVGLTGEVYKYDGSGNGTLVIAVNDFQNEGPYDLIADCDGNFYLFNATGINATPYLRKYSSTGVLLQSWTVNNPNNFLPNAGFAVEGTSFFTDEILSTFFGFATETGVTSGTWAGSTVDMNAVSIAMPPFTVGTAFYRTYDLASCDEAIPRLAEVTIASSDTAFCGARKVDYWITGVQNPGLTPTYQWLINGNPVAGANDTFFNYTAQNGDMVTCQIVSSDYCVAITTATSNPITMLVEEAIQPILSYIPNEFCTDVITAVLPTVNTAGGAFTATTGLSINSGTGEITPSLSAPGEYVVTYTNPPPVLCPLYSATAVINVHSPADASIEADKFNQPVCLGDTVILRAKEANGNIYSWEPKERIIGAVDDPTAIVNRSQSGTVSLTVYAKGGCMDKDSVTIDAGQSCCRVFMPSAFSPNNDGINDFMEIQAAEIQAITGLKVFNRYGQIVFETSNIKDKWDGTKGGKLCDVGAYYYLLYYSCDDGMLFQKKGDIMLIR